MSNFDRWASFEHRRRFRGTGIALALVILALIIPAADAQQEWVKTRVIWLSALFLAFQFGQVWHAMRMSRARDSDRVQQFQSGSTSAPTTSSPAQAPASSSSSRIPFMTGSSGADVQDACSPNGATLTANTAPSVALREKQHTGDMSRMAHQNRGYLIDEDKVEIRAYANIEEATRHGWVFGPSIAVFGDQPVPESATLGAKTYVYSGLGPKRNTALVSPDMRLFGPLSYRLMAPLNA